MITMNFARAMAVRIIAAGKFFNGFTCAVSLMFLLASGTSAAQTTFGPTTGVAATGATLYSAACSGCHGAGGASSIAIRNAANAGRVINLSMARGMGGFAAGSYNDTQENDLAAHIATFVTSPNPNGQAVTFNSGGAAVSLPNIYLSTAFGAYTGVVSVVAPARGSVTYSSTTATYTPTTGQCGTDSFSWRGQGVFDTPGLPVANDTYQSSTRSSSVVIANPAAPVISTGATGMSGTAGVVISTYSPVNTGGTPLSYTLSGVLPTGLNFNSGNGQISGTPSQAGTFNVTLNAFNCAGGNLTGQSGSRAITITVAQGSQAISFGALPNKLTTDVPFVVSATGGGSGNPVTFTSSGVCTAGGVNGSTITLTATPGTCTVTANQAGNTNYTAAPTVMQSFTVSDPAAEVFPPNCTMPPGWVLPPGSTYSWTIATAAGDAADGTCGLKSQAMPLAAVGTTNAARIQITANFDAGNISFKRRVGSEQFWDCFRFQIGGVSQNVGASSGCFGPDEQGISGVIPYATATVPIAAGLQTVTFVYETDDTNQFNGDAAWIDSVSMPLATSINSALLATGVYNQAFSHFVTATNFPVNVTATGLPPGLSFNPVTRQIFGTPSVAGNFNVTLTASNPAGVNSASTDMKTLTIIIDKASQSINFPPINNRLNSAPAFTVSAAGGSSGLPVTFTASGVCTSGGVNGATITTGLTLGNCTVNANQGGDANYYPASTSQSFDVVGSAFETFPPFCNMPAGWTVPVGAATGWSVVANQSSTEGACSLRSNALSIAAPGTTNKAQIAFTGNFSAGNITFKRRVSSENGWDCFRFFIGATAQNVGASTGCFGPDEQGVSGEVPFGSVSIPIGAGTQTVTISYETDDTFQVGADAAWIDELVMPLFTLSVSKNGTGSGTVSSQPAAINCGATCSAVMSGNVQLIPAPAFLNYFAGWSGACSGTGACIVSMTANRSVTATFNTVLVPSAPQNVVATPGNATASFQMDPPASNGGSAITGYSVLCDSIGQPTVFNNGPTPPIVLTGMVNGATYSCAVRAGNIAGSSAAVTVMITPITIPGVPIGVMATPGNTQALIGFTSPASNGGASISGYTATCTAFLNPDRSATGAGPPLLVNSMVNGVAYSCSVVATNVAGNSLPSASVNVTPFTNASAPQNLAVIPRDGRAILSFDPPLNDGGNPVLAYSIDCTPGGNTSTAASPPLTITGLSNGMPTNCTVRGVNAAGNGAAATFPVFTPNVQLGATYWTQVCSACHGMTPVLPQLNAAGTTGTVLSYALVNQAAMALTPALQELTAGERDAIAAYLKDQLPASAETTPFNTPKLLNFSSQISLGTVSFESLEVVTPPANGILSAFTGTAITYTPNAGYVGPDSFTFRGSRAMPMALQGDPRTVIIAVQPPPTPMITSALMTSGTFGAAFSYTITASNSPTSFGAMGLPIGLMVNPMTGAISGAPAAGGTFMATISATNAGGTGSATLTITVNPTTQSINFPAQMPATQTYALAPANTFDVSPLASATSGLQVAYTSTTPAFCTVSGSTVTIVAAGPCIIAANQAGDANFAAASQVTQSVTITPVLPGAPVIGMATPGNTQATIAFSSPSNTGGTTITGYTATCGAAGQTTRIGTGMVSPITVGTLVNGVTYSCSVTATNSVGTSVSASASATVTPAPTPTAPIITSAINASFTVNAPGSFNVTATGTPSVFTFGVTGALPVGVSLNSMTGNLSGTPTQAGMFTVTLSVSNGVVPNASQMFTLNVSKAAQTISFTGPGSQPLNAGSVAVSAFATSGLTVAFASTTPMVCTVSGTTVNFDSAGTCTVNASQAGDANFLVAADVAQNFSIGQGTQTLTFGAQMSPLSYAVNGMFGLAPLASASSGLVPTYSSLTQSVCTIAATTVTMVRAGACTIATNQAGNANYSPATPVTQTITISGIAPGAPTLNTATGGDNKITLAFSPPASDGGVSVSSYSANCGGVTAIGSASPITVAGLMNGSSYSCTVTASNSIGMPPASNALMATPNPLPGAAVWAAKCSGCHSPAPFGSRLNVGGNTAAVLNYVIDTNVPLAMVPIIGNLTIMTPTERTQLSQYIQEFVPPVAPTTAANTAVGIDVTSQIVMNTAIVGFTSLEVITPPTNGSINSIVGTTINYTPNNGFTGTDTFTYRGKQAGAGIGGDPRSVSVTVSSEQPVITSALTVNGIIGQAFNYQIAATNIPNSYNATPLPNGLAVNMSSGQITGMPSAAGSTMVTISATNTGGTGNATLVINVNLIPQIITFGAQPSPINFVSGGVVMIAPGASGGASGNPIVYSSLTPSVCSAGAGTITMLAAGVCTIAANQAGNATFAAAAQVTRSVTINGSAPGAPTIGSPTAGNTQVTINFTAPVNTGGLAITSYTANCSGIANNGPASPIVVSGLVNGVSYACTVQATNPAGTGPVSGTVMVTPAAIAFTGNVFSRKTHGNGVGDKDLPISNVAINGAITVEPRAIGTGHRIVFVFTNPVTSVTSLSVQDAGLNIVGSASPSFSGNELILTLNGVPDNRRVTVSATGVNGALDVSRSIGFLTGDVNSSASVNAADISAVKSRVGQGVTTANFIFDLNTTGIINNADVTTAKARAGLTIP